MHPVTYVNKMLFYGGTQMELWNVIEQEKIYSFTLPSTIETVVQSPVVDVVAVGCTDGSIHLINLLYDEVLFKFSHRDGAVSAITFLTDATLGLSLMASTSQDNGSIVLWDLNARKIHAVMEGPHAGKDITQLSFLANEPVLVSASDEDNSIKMWLFEKGQVKPRLLRERGGHSEAPHMLRFYGGLDDPNMQGARNLITCSKDGNLRDISLLNELQSMNFSRKKQLTKVNDGLDSGPVSQFAFSTFRENEWQNVLTCHQAGGEGQVGQVRDSVHAKPQLWSSVNHSISKVQVQMVSKTQSRVTSVAVTKCGNFGVLGFANGAITKFNMQSGKERGVFALEAKSKSAGASLHTAEVTGLAVDAVNRFLVSCAKDRTIKLWDFYRCKLLRSFDAEYPVNNLCYSATSDLVAFTSSDLSMTILNP